MPWVWVSKAPNRGESEVLVDLEHGIALEAYVHGGRKKKSVIELLQKLSRGGLRIGRAILFIMTRGTMNQRMVCWGSR